MASSGASSEASPRSPHSPPHEIAHVRPAQMPPYVPTPCVPTVSITSESTADTQGDLRPGQPPQPRPTVPLLPPLLPLPMEMSSTSSSLAGPAARVPKQPRPDGGSFGNAATRTPNQFARELPENGNRDIFGPQFAFLKAAEVDIRGDTSSPYKSPKALHVHTVTEVPTTAKEDDLAASPLAMLRTIRNAVMLTASLAMKHPFAQREECDSSEA